MGAVAVGVEADLATGGADVTQPYVSWYGKGRLQTWRTPPDFFAKQHARFSFTLDGAATEENKLLPLASTISAPISWAGHRVFCNPPWSDIASFVSLAPCADLAVLLVPARSNARWFHAALRTGAKPEFFEGRLKFVGPKSGTCPVDCCLLVWGA